MLKPKTNPLLDIQNHPDFEIPVPFRDTGKNEYFEQLEHRYGTILSFLNSCEEDDFGRDIKDNVVQKVANVQKSILSIIKEYLNGHPSIAFDMFERFVLKYELDKELKTLQQVKVPANQIFFRVQKQFTSIPASDDGLSGMIKYKQALDLFHPPFQRRRSVGTNRFSISGYPCLYLSQNLQTSYSECFPDMGYSSFHAIGFKNVRPLYFLDLTKEKLAINPDLFESDLKENDPSDVIDHLGLYQLIIASHTKVEYVPFYPGENYFFKIEYIIPQLILQWLTLQGGVIDGIQYNSCTGLASFPAIKTQYNFVLPVKKGFVEEGYCPTLSSLFLATDVYSYLNPAKPNIEPLLENIIQDITSSSFTPLVTT